MALFFGLLLQSLLLGYCMAERDGRRGFCSLSEPGTLLHLHLPKGGSLNTVSTLECADAHDVADDVWSLLQDNIWEFPKIRRNRNLGPSNKDPPT